MISTQMKLEQDVLDALLISMTMKFKIVMWPDNENPEFIRINQKKIQKDSYVVSTGDKVIIIFDDSGNNKLFEYKTLNDYV